MSTVAAPVESPVSKARSGVSVPAVLGIVAMLLAHLPIFWRYVVGLVELPHYEFVMLLPVGAAVIAYPRVRRLGNLAPGAGWPFYAFATWAVCFLLIAIVMDSPWVGGISLLPAVAAAAYAVGGRRLLLAVLPAWALLWIGVRVPLTMDIQLSQQLQSIAAERASHVMNYFNVDHILDGNVVITPPDTRYMVEEACSGVQSLFAITACALFFGLWMRERPGRILLLLVIAWWWVWVANVVRVVAVTVLSSQWNLPVDEGWGHDALTIVLFAVTLGLIVSSEHLFLFLLPRGVFSRNDRIDVGQIKPLPDYGPTHLPQLGRTYLAAPAFIGVYLGLAVLQWLPQLYVAPPSATPMQLQALTVDLAPERIGDWVLIRDAYEAKQRRDDSQWGAHSNTWQYAKGPLKMVVSIDYPFRGWHELTICYEADGWRGEARNVVDAPRADGPPDKCVAAVMHRPEESQYAYLLFTCLNDRQQPLPSERMDILKKLNDRITSFGERVATLGASGNVSNDQVQSFQIQVLMQGPTKPGKAESDDAAAAFAEFRARLTEFLAAQEKAGGAQ